MPSLTNPHDFNRPMDPGGFCYLCGRPLEDGPTNTQHVVPKGLFHPDHRSLLLMLVAHEACNAAESMNDQDIGQLVGLLWRTPEEADRNADRLRKKVSLHRLEGSVKPLGSVEDIPLREIIFRWVQGFHAALYGEFLPEQVHRVVQEPFPGGDEIGRAYRVQPWHSPLVEVIKKNGRAGRLDVIDYASGKCRYHCVWDETDDEQDMCIFALDLYGWWKLGDIHYYPERHCVGTYIHPRPANGSIAVGRDVPLGT